MAAPTTMPLLFRALHHLAESGYEPEADSAFALCRATCWSEPIARGTRHLDFFDKRSRLEYNAKMGILRRMGWLVDRGGVEVRVWEEGWAEPRWKLALFDSPPVFRSVDEEDDSDEEEEKRAEFDYLTARWPAWPAHAYPLA